MLIYKLLFFELCFMFDWVIVSFVGSMVDIFVFKVIGLVCCFLRLEHDAS